MKWLSRSTFVAVRRPISWSSGILRALKASVALLGPKFGCTAAADPVPTETNTGPLGCISPA